MILAADDLRDPHLDVVAHDAQVVQRTAVRSQQGEVLDIRVLPFLNAINTVFESRGAALGNLEAQGEGAAVLARPQPVEEGRAAATYVKIARRARRKADANAHRSLLTDAVETASGRTQAGLGDALARDVVPLQAKVDGAAGHAHE